MSVPQDIEFKSWDDDLQRMFHCNRKVGMKHIIKILKKHFDVDNPVKFQQELTTKRKLQKPGYLFPDQHKILFAGTGAYINEFDSTLLLKVLRLTKDSLLSVIEDLQQIRNWIAHNGSKPLSKTIFQQKFNDQKILLKQLGATDIEINYWLHVTLDCREDEHRKAVEGLLMEIREATAEPISDVVLKVALDIVCQDIDNLWDTLAIGLGTKQEVLDSISILPLSYDRKMERCFQHHQNNISWYKLRMELSKIARDDIVDKIKNQTHITIGLYQFADSLKNDMIISLEKVENKQFFNDEEMMCFVNRNQYFVSLTTAHISELEKNQSISEHEYNMQTLKLEKNLGIEEVIEESDSLILVRGIGGIGKSSLLEYITFAWSTGNMLNSLKYIYLIRGRTLSDLKGQSLLDILRSQYPLLKTLSDIEMLDIAQHSLVLLDGYDELSSQDKDHICSIIKDGIVKQQFKVLITSRPEALTHLFKSVKCLAPKLIDVLGLAQKNIELFVEKHYKLHKNKDEMLNNFKQLMEHNVGMKSLSSIPLYLEILLCLNDHITKDEFPDTKTGLFLLAALVTIQTNNKQLGLTGNHIMDVIENNALLDIMRTFARLSFHALRTGNIIFFKNDIGKDTELLLNSGLLFKCRTVRGEAYQFIHLIFVEVFAGLHFHLERNIKILYKVDMFSKLWEALPTAAALQVLANKEENGKYVILRKLILFLDFGISNFHDITTYVKKRHQLDECGKMVKRLVKFDSFMTSIILETLYELNEKPKSKKVLQWIQRSYFESVELRHHYDVKYAKKMFTYLPGKKINFLVIDFHDGLCTNDDLDNLKNVIQQCEEIFTMCFFDCSKFLSCVTFQDNTFANLTALTLFASNAITSMHNLDCFIPLAEYIPKLETFSFYMNAVSQAFCINMSTAICKAKDEDNLNLKEMYIYELDDNFISIFQCLPHVKTFNICEANIPILDAESISTAFNDSQNLKHLVFWECKLTKNELRQLMPAFRYITRLDIFNKESTPCLVEPIVECIQSQISREETTNLRRLSFSCLDEDSVKLLLDIIDELDGLRIIKTTISPDWCVELKFRKKSSRKLQLRIVSNREELNFYQSIFHDSRNIHLTCSAE